MDWDSRVQKELFELKKDLKKKQKEVDSLKTVLCQERDRVYKRERKQKAEGKDKGMGE